MAREAAAQERLRQVVDSSSDPIVDIHPDGVVRGWNRAAERVYGYAAAEVLGRSIALVVPPDARGRLLATVAEVVASRNSRTYEGLRMRRDGSTFFAETTLSPIIDARGEVVGVAAVLHDLSARKTAEEALARAHRSEQRRREALERVNVATDVVSVALAELPNAPLPVLLQVFVEQAVEAIRCDHAAIEERDGGGPVAERGSPPDPETAVTLEVPIAWRKQRFGTFRVARRRQEGALTDEEVLIVKLLAARAAAAIEISRTYAREAGERAWLASAIDQMPDPVVLLDAGGRIKHVNPAALRLTRAARRAVEGGSSELVFELKRPSGETIALDESPLMRALRGREVVRGEEIRVGEGEGAVPMVVTAAPVVEASGRLLGAAMVARDVSAGKALERMREEWTSVVAHDLRQPVSVIHLTAQRLMMLVPSANGEHDLLVR
ncbi:MAG TPA: PAS domain S-box protein, partial [Polyangia bacterium]